MKHNVGILFKILNLALFTVMSLCLMKVDKNIHRMQVFFTIACAAFITMLPIILWKHKKIPKIKNVKAYLARSIFNVLGMVTWIEALRFLSGNDATAITFMIPIFTAILAIIFLKEKANLKCFGAIFVSFVGAYMIVKPTAGIISHGAMIALFSALMWACHDIVCKIQASTEDKFVQTFYTFLIMLFFSMPFALPVMQKVSNTELFQISIVGVLSAANVTVLFLAYKFAPVNLLMPFSYLRLIFMAIATYMLFGEVLSTNSMIGAFIIATSSIYIFQQQQKGKISVV